MTSEPSRRSPFGLRGRLAIWGGAILFATLAIAFVATYGRTESDLRSQVDENLKATADGVARAIGNRGTTPAATRRRAEAAVRARAFEPSVQLIVVDVPGAGVVTDQPELLGLHRGREGDDDGESEERAGENVRSARPGWETIPTEEAGDVRIYTREAGPVGDRVALVHVGEPLDSVDRALAGLGRTLLLIGLLALLTGAGAMYLVASGTTRKLRKMAAVAGEIDEGVLDARMDAGGPHDEVRRLADSFDHMLDRLQEAFGRQRAFVSDASHELRTPLTVVRGQIEILSRTPDPAPQDIARVSELVTEAVRRMERLVDDLLLLAKTDEGLALERSTVRVKELLQVHVEGFLPFADGRRIAVGSELDGTIRADADRIGQVLSILITNAIEHTASDGRIEVSATARGSDLVIDVDDDGPGVSPAERELVFERFHRSDSSRSRRSGGSGLGLAIARALIHAHGGEVDVRESPMGGARFEVTLPGLIRGSAQTGRMAGSGASSTGLP